MLMFARARGHILGAHARARRPLSDAAARLRYQGTASGGIIESCLRRGGKS